MIFKYLIQYLYNLLIDFLLNKVPLDRFLAFRTLNSLKNSEFQVLIVGIAEYTHYFKFVLNEKLTTCIDIDLNRLNKFGIGTVIHAEIISFLSKNNKKFDRIFLCGLIGHGISSDKINLLIKLAKNNINNNGQIYLTVPSYMEFYDKSFIKLIDHSLSKISCDNLYVYFG